MEETIEITEKWNKKGYLVERYCIDSNGNQCNLPIPKFAQEKPTVVFWNPDIDWIKQTKQVTKEELKLLKATN